jgi:hypothetical protein
LYLPGHRQIGQFGRSLDAQALDAELWWFDQGPPFGQRLTPDAAIGLFGQTKQRIVIHIADHDEGGVVGRVPATIPVPRINMCQVFEVIHPADDRPAIRVSLKRHRIHPLVQQRLWIVVGTQAPLLDHHFDLLSKFLGIEFQIRHAIGLERHHRRQRALRHLLEVSGVVATGEGVVASADRRHPFGKLTRTERAGAFEHHVLEHMGDAGGAIHFVDGTGAIPDHMHHGRRAMVFLDNDVQAIGQRFFMGIGMQSAAK